MNCPECGNANRAGAAECEFCGHALTAEAASRRTQLDRAPPPDPAKRRTVYEPGPGAPARPQADDPFTSPPPKRPVYDPHDPFRAAIVPPRAPAAPVAAPAAGAPPFVPPAADSATPRQPTVIGQPVARRPGAVLLALAGPEDPGRVFVLAEGRNTVGRDEGQDLRLEDGRVSGQHAFLFVRADGVSFIDVSTNGSLVDGKPVHGRQVDVDTGAVLRLGDTVLVLTRLAPVPAGAWGGA